MDKNNKTNHNFSLSSKDKEVFKSALKKKITQFGKPSLAFIFINADLAIQDIHSFLDSEGISHIGSSSYGEICDNQFSKGMYAGLFIYLPEDSFKIYASKQIDGPISGEELGAFSRDTFDNPGIYMLIASKTTSTDKFISQVQQNTSKNIPLYGGHAFDNLKFEKYTVFASNYLSNNGVVAIVFNCDKIELIGDAYSGWDCIGKTHTITKSDRNEILEIDGKPTLDVFTSYFDYFDVEKAVKGEDGRYAISNHPIKIFELNGSTTLRSPIHLSLERNSLIFYSNMEEGKKFKFCINPKIEIVDNLINRLKQIHKTHDDIDGLLVTSCTGRYLTLGPFFKKEVKQIFQIWNKPTTGFLSAGEIGNTIESNISCFHNVTCVITGIKIK